MKARDWRSLSLAEVERWYGAERVWWASVLSWDSGESWSAVERARASGTLPGVVVYDGPREMGWSFFLPNDGSLQIGALTARTPAAAAYLVESILATPEAVAATRSLVFVPMPEVWLADVLARHGFQVRPFRYMIRALGPDRRAVPPSLPFDHARVSEVASLLGRAYPGPDPSRPFAPNGQPVEWLDYATNLVTQRGCGALLPDCSVLEPSAPNRLELIGVVLATRVSDRTGHLAQVVVDPCAQRRGLGASMIRTALARLQGRGFTHASLLVADDNVVATRMYERLGFREVARFASAWRPQPTRSTIAACSPGVARTLR